MLLKDVEKCFASKNTEQILFILTTQFSLFTLAPVDQEKLLAQLEFKQLIIIFKGLCQQERDNNTLLLSNISTLSLFIVKQRIRFFSHMVDFFRNASLSERADFLPSFLTLLICIPNDPVTEKESNLHSEFFWSISELLTEEEAIRFLQYAYPCVSLNALTRVFFLRKIKFPQNIATELPKFYKLLESTPLAKTDIVRTQHTIRANSYHFNHEKVIQPLLQLLDAVMRKPLDATASSIDILIYNFYTSFPKEVSFDSSPFETIKISIFIGCILEGFIFDNIFANIPMAVKKLLKYIPHDHHKVFSSQLEKFSHLYFCIKQIAHSQNFAYNKAILASFPPYENAENNIEIEKRYLMLLEHSFHELNIFNWKTAKDFSIMSEISRIFSLKIVWETLCKFLKEQHNSTSENLAWFSRAAHALPVQMLAHNYVSQFKKIFDDVPMAVKCKVFSSKNRQFFDILDPSLAGRIKMHLDCVAVLQQIENAPSKRIMEHCLALQPLLPLSEELIEDKKEFILHTFIPTLKNAALQVDLKSLSLLYPVLVYLVVATEDSPTSLLETMAHSSQKHQKHAVMFLIDSSLMISLMNYFPEDIRKYFIEQQDENGCNALQAYLRSSSISPQTVQNFILSGLALHTISKPQLPLYTYLLHQKITRKVIVSLGTHFTTISAILNQPFSHQPLIEIILQDPQVEAEAVEYLLEKGMSLDYQDRPHSPLEMAAYSFREDLIRLFLKYGASYTKYLVENSAFITILSHWLSHLTLQTTPFDEETFLKIERISELLLPHETLETINTPDINQRPLIEKGIILNLENVVTYCLSLEERFHQTAEIEKLLIDKVNSLMGKISPLQKNTHKKWCRRENILFSILVKNGLNLSFFNEQQQQFLLLHVWEGFEEKWQLYEASLNHSHYSFWQHYFMMSPDFFTFYFKKYPSTQSRQLSPSEKALFQAWTQQLGLASLYLSLYQGAPHAISAILAFILEGNTALKSEDIVACLTLIQTHSITDGKSKADFILALQENLFFQLESLVTKSMFLEILQKHLLLTAYFTKDMPKKLLALDVTYLNNAPLLAALPLSSAVALALLTKYFEQLEADVIAFLNTFLSSAEKLSLNETYEHYRDFSPITFFKDLIAKKETAKINEFWSDLSLEDKRQAFKIFCQEERYDLATEYYLKETAAFPALWASILNDLPLCKKFLKYLYTKEKTTAQIIIAFCNDLTDYTIFDDDFKKKLILFLNSNGEYQKAFTILLSLENAMKQDLSQPALVTCIDAIPLESLNDSHIDILYAYIHKNNKSYWPEFLIKRYEKLVTHVISQKAQQGFHSPLMEKRFWQSLEEQQIADSLHWLMKCSVPMREKIYATLIEKQYFDFIEKNLFQHSTLKTESRMSIKAIILKKNSLSLLIHFFPEAIEETYLKNQSIDSLEEGLKKELILFFNATAAYQNAFTLLLTLVNLKEDAALPDLFSSLYYLPFTHLNDAHIHMLYYYLHQNKIGSTFLIHSHQALADFVIGYKAARGTYSPFIERFFWRALEAEMFYESLQWLNKAPTLMRERIYTSLVKKRQLTFIENILFQDPFLATESQSFIQKIILEQRDTLLLLRWFPVVIDSAYLQNNQIELPQLIEQVNHLFTEKSDYLFTLSPDLSENFLDHTLSSGKIFHPQFCLSIAKHFCTLFHPTLKDLESSLAAINHLRTEGIALIKMLIDKDCPILAISPAELKATIIKKLSSINLQREIPFHLRDKYDLDTLKKISTLFTAEYEKNISQKFIRRCQQILRSFEKTLPAQQMLMPSRKNIPDYYKNLFVFLFRWNRLMIFMGIHFPDKTHFFAQHRLLTLDAHPYLHTIPFVLETRCVLNSLLYAPTSYLITLGGSTLEFLSDIFDGLLSLEFQDPDDAPADGDIHIQIGSSTDYYAFQERSRECMALINSHVGFSRNINIRFSPLDQAERYAHADLQKTDITTKEKFGGLVSSTGLKMVYSDTEDFGALIFCPLLDHLMHPVFLRINHHFYLNAEEYTGLTSPLDIQNFSQLSLWKHFIKVLLRNALKGIFLIPQQEQSVLAYHLNNRKNLPFFANLIENFKTQILLPMSAQQYQQMVAILDAISAPYHINLKDLLLSSFHHGEPQAALMLRQFPGFSSSPLFQSGVSQNQQTTAQRHGPKKK